MKLTCWVDVKKLSLSLSLFFHFIYLFWLRRSSLWMRGLFSSGHAGASHCSGFSCCGAQAPGCGLQWLLFLGSRAQAQELRCTVLVALQCVGSSRTRDWTRVSCTSRWVLYCWATREAREPFLRWLRKTLRVSWVTKIKQLHNRNVHFTAPDIWHITRDVFSLPRKKNSWFQDGRNFLVRSCCLTGNILSLFWCQWLRFTEFSTKGYKLYG